MTNKFKEEDIGSLRRSTSLRSRVRTSSGGAGGTQQQGQGRVRPISLNRDRSYVNVLTRVTNLEPAPIIGRRQSIVAAAEKSSPTLGFNV